MTSRPIAACALLAVSLGGCVLYVYEPDLRVESEIDGWESTAAMARQADAAFHARLADVLVSVRADDPFTPVRARVRPGAAATVTVLRDGGAAGTVGAWRLGDRNGLYLSSRVPRPFAFGDALEAPAGAELLLEFDPHTVVDGDSVTSGCMVAFSLRFESGGDVETMPVALRVADVHRGWAIGPPVR